MKLAVTVYADTRWLEYTRISKTTCGYTHKKSHTISEYSDSCLTAKYYKGYCYVKGQLVGVCTNI